MGHIRKLDARRYQARYRDPAGRERARNFARKADAERYLATVEADKIRGAWTDPRLGQQTLGDWIEAVEDMKRDRRPSTIARDRSVIDNLILPSLAGFQLRHLQARHVDEWITDLSAGGYAPSTIRKAYQLLSGALEKAITSDLIPRSPCRGISLPKPTAPEMRFLDIDQVKLLADTVGDRYRALILTAAFTGLRFGELAGLRITNLNLLKRSLRVEETLVDVRGRLRVGPPKTAAARRTVSLPPFLAEELGAHLARYPTDRLVFRSDASDPIRRTNFRRRVWVPAVRETVGPPCRFHDLRHSHAALLIRENVHPKVIQQRLGHASIRTTLDTYGHLFDGLDRAAAEALDSVWTDPAADSVRTYA